MIFWLKKHFIPHEGNDHRPHILCDSDIRIIVFILILLEIIIFLFPTLTNLNRTNGMAAVLPAVLASLTNEEREDQNLKILKVNQKLNEAAEMKAKDMATKGYFAHTSPEGKTPWYWIEKVGYDYQFAGENLAINFSDSKDVTGAWMNSPTHKANIIKGNYTEIGTGVAVGVYKGKEAVFVAQIYANPFPEVFQKTELNNINSKKIENVSLNKELNNNVLGAEVEVASSDIKKVNNSELNLTPIKEANFFQKTFASPRNTVNIILYIIFGLIAIALILYIFIKMKNYHIDLITNGLIVLAIVGAIFITNYYLSHHNMSITQSIDYSNKAK